MTATSNADQIAYWNGDVGARWVAQQERLDAMLKPISNEVLKAARVTSGEHVLDIGCGCGDTSIALSKSGARVLGADVSAPMLALAKRRAAEANTAITFTEADAANHKFDAGAFDLLFSRFGVMFFANPDEAFANMRKALKATGRLAFVCWRDWRENEWVRIPIMAIRPHVPPQPQLGPEDPGPFAFADPARVRRILANGGFDEITLKPFDTKVEIGNSLTEAVTYLQEFGPVSRALSEASPAQKEQAAKSLNDALAPFAKTSPITLGAGVWIVTAKA